MKITLYPPLSIYEIGQRDNQEDAIVQWDNRLFVLCDGMGGHERGEVASQTVCSSLEKWFEDNIEDDSFSDDQLREALEYAYTELDKYDDDGPRKMGTTLTLLFFHNKGVTAAHIGDSRIYHIFLTGKILYQSRDHSLAFDLFQAGEITYEEIATFPQKNIVTRAMTPGVDNRMRPDIIHITDIEPDDYFYMCSDGMLEQMSNQELVDILISDKSDKEKCNQLITATAANQDNHSAWLIHVKNVEGQCGENVLSNEESTARCNVLNIKPVINQGNDVQIAESDDVTIVSVPTKPMQKWVTYIKPFLITVFCIVILFIGAFLVFGGDDNGKDELSHPMPMIQSPINKHGIQDNSKDTTIKDSNNIQTNEPARNQQPVNAPRGNRFTRHIQNR